MKIQIGEDIHNGFVFDIYFLFDGVVENALLENGDEEVVQHTFQNQFGSSVVVFVFIKHVL